jgi:Family of unknown function (DUF5709)
MSSPDEAAEQDVWAPHNEGQLSADDTLDDRGVDDALDEGYSPPERYRGSTAFGVTATEARLGESLDQRMAQENPDWSAALTAPPAHEDLDDDDALTEADEFFDSTEVGGPRSGRLVAPGLDPGSQSQWEYESDLIAEDVGVDGGAASAEEAAMHVVDWP